MMYSLNEIGLIPKPVTDVEHRIQIDPFTDDHTLPIFVAPMTCIISKENYKDFAYHNFIPILPVISKIQLGYYLLEAQNGWVAMTLDGFKQCFIDRLAKDNPNKPYKILIDCANGHMKSIYDLVDKAKNHYGNHLQLMIGNIANPETYLECCTHRIDYVRVGIGGGSGCTTSVLTGFHASLPWLITEIKQIKDNLIYDEDTKFYHVHPEVLAKYGFLCGFSVPTKTKIIADGGINSIDKAIKCLALGADYVMMGNLFAQCEEACSERKKEIISIPRVIDDLIAYQVKYEFKETFLHKYYGQSSHQGQLDRFGVVKGNIEGNESWVEIKYTLEELEKLITDALRSSMSYNASFTLNDFIGNVRYEIMSESEFKLYNK